MQKHEQCISYAFIRRRIGFKNVLYLTDNSKDEGLVAVELRDYLHSSNIYFESWTLHFMLSCTFNFLTYASRFDCVLQFPTSHTTSLDFLLAISSGIGRNIHRKDSFIEGKGKHKTDQIKHSYNNNNNIYSLQPKIQNLKSHCRWKKGKRCSRKEIVEAWLLKVLEPSWENLWTSVGRDNKVNLSKLYLPFCFMVH